jgi:osmoprotectant transport system permease protein
MGSLRGALSWLADGSHWTGAGGILQRLAEHLQMFAIVMLIAVAIALPLGLVIGHARRGAFLAVNAAGIGRALPSFAILAFAFPLALRLHLPGPFAFWPTLVTLVFLAVPPLLTNTYVAVANVDADTVEAARGIGMTERQVLLRLELPLAAPLMLDTIRTVAVQVTATATLGAAFGWGGLGRFIVDGFSNHAYPAYRDQLLAGAILVALLAIVVDVVFGLIGRFPALRRVQV